MKKIVSAVLCLMMLLTMMPLTAFAEAGGAPGNPQISHDNWDKDKNFNIKVNMWYGNNGTTLRIFRDGEMVHEEALKDNTPSAQNITVPFENHSGGTFKFWAELSNAHGTTASNKIDVEVKKDAGDLEPIPNVEPPTKRSIAYFTEWGIYGAHDYYTVDKMPFEKITHINYAFAIMNDNLEIDVYDKFAALEKTYPGESYDSPFKGNFGQLKKYKRMYPHLKTLISVGGWTRSEKFHEMAKTQETRQRFADSCVRFIREHEFDGVDIDWEYPGIDRPKDPNDKFDKGAPGGPEDRENFTLLMKTLRETLDRAAQEDNTEYLLTAAMGIGYDKIKHTDISSYIQYMDFINLMTYDMHGAWEELVGHQAPLYPNPNDTHEAEVVEKYNVDWAVSKFINEGVTPEKITLGLPFYSRGWKNVSGGNNGMFGTGTGDLEGVWGPGGQSPYYEIKKLENDPRYTKHRDEYSRVPWLYSEELGELYTYDDAQSISEKCDYAISKNLGGMMFWEMAGDPQEELTNVIYNKMK